LPSNQPIKPVTQIIISRATKSQYFSAVSRVYETSTNQISPLYLVIRSKKSQNLSLGQTFLQHSFALKYQYFIETTTTDIDMLLQVDLQFCNNSRFIAISDIMMLFCPLLDD